MVDRASGESYGGGTPITDEVPQGYGGLAPGGAFDRAGGGLNPGGGALPSPMAGGGVNQFMEPAPNMTSMSGEAVHAPSPADFSQYGQQEGGGEPNWLERLGADVGEMGYDDYKKLAGQIFEGSNEAGDQGGFPQMPASLPLREVPRTTGSQSFHSLYNTPQRRGGGLF